MRASVGILLLGLTVVTICLGQTVARVVSGKVVSESGVPIKDVEVYGTKWTCCPATVKSTTTGTDGKFTLANAGPVLHFRSNGLEPFSIVPGKDTPLTVTMKRRESTLWDIPKCGPHEQVRFGQTFLFQPPPGKSLAKGQDIDYTRYGIKGQDGGLLDSWFGPTAAAVDASEDFYLKSKSFSERFVEVSGYGIVGIDSRGVSKDGRHWRWVGLRYAMVEGGKSLMGTFWHWPRMGATDMIRYDQATDGEAKEFDLTIDSACLKRE